MPIARTALAAIAPVEVAPDQRWRGSYFRVRVGPFAAVSEAEAALVKVTAAGYRGAKVVRKN